MSLSQASAGIGNLSSLKFSIFLLLPPPLPPLLLLLLLLLSFPKLLNASAICLNRNPATRLPMSVPKSGGSGSGSGSDGNVRVLVFVIVCKSSY